MKIYVPTTEIGFLNNNFSLTLIIILYLEWVYFQGGAVPPPPMLKRVI